MHYGNGNPILPIRHIKAIVFYSGKKENRRFLERERHWSDQFRCRPFHLSVFLRKSGRIVVATVISRQNRRREDSSSTAISITEVPLQRLRFERSRNAGVFLIQPCKRALQELFRKISKYFLTTIQERYILYLEFFLNSF